MGPSPVYVVGVGISYLNISKSESALHDVAISAGTKALLDAGITYGDVDLSLACFLGDDLKIPKASFNSFGKTGSATAEVDSYSGFFGAAQYVGSGHAQCALMVGFDKDISPSGSSQSSLQKLTRFIAPTGLTSRTAAVATVLVSQSFLASHSFLKDSAALIRATELVSPIYSRSARVDSETLATKTAIQRALSNAVLAPDDIQIVELRHGSNLSAQQALGELRVSEDGHASPVSNPFRGTTGLAGLCELVWQLRGWTHNRAVQGTQNGLQYTMGPDGTAYVTILSRADRKVSPHWEQIKHLRDGRERQGNNPATDVKDISYEDWQAVKAQDEFVPEQIGKQLKLPVKGGDRAALARL